MRLKDADVISGIMYRKAFEEDSDLQIWDSGCWTCYKMFERALEEAPTIEAEPVRRGRWLFENIGKPNEHCVCSECGTQADSDEAWNYCPQCGALMEGKEEEHDEDVRS
ncbi:MAG: hypothetical protein IJQ80_02395 [Clostridia bacterium]|nr:hypothetical protein [Clostridia bacterium]